MEYSAQLGARDGKFWMIRATFGYTLLLRHLPLQTALHYTQNNKICDATVTSCWEVKETVTSGDSTW